MVLMQFHSGSEPTAFPILISWEVCLHPGQVSCQPMEFPNALPITPGLTTPDRLPCRHWGATTPGLMAASACAQE
jgi:hypothetical protein